jgi:hypothetical protein
MKLQISENQLSWTLDGSPYVIHIDNLEQAIFSENQNVIAVLAGENSKSQKIRVYELNGTIRHEIEQPKDHYFNYLGSNRGKDLAVMSKVRTGGWHDWWFEIDAKEGELDELGEGR